MPTVYAKFCMNHFASLPISQPSQTGQATSMENEDLIDQAIIESTYDEKKGGRDSGHFSRKADAWRTSHRCWR